MKQLPRRPDGKKYSRGFLRNAARYGQDRKNPTTMFDFSHKALFDFFMKESHGHATKPNNGYAVGKFYCGITEQLVIEDITKGHCTKAERLESKHYWFWIPILAGVCPNHTESSSRLLYQTDKRVRASKTVAIQIT